VKGIENSVKVARANLNLFGFIKRLPVEVCVPHCRQMAL
jgi:hypothetical protein